MQHPGKSGDTQQKSTKPNVQRVMDLLQQLQRQSRSSVDLPDLVQQLLRCNGGSFEAAKRDPTILSKCRSFTEGTYPELKDEQQRAIVAQLRNMMGGSSRADDCTHSKAFAIPYQPSRPDSLLHTANTSYNSLYFPSKTHPSQIPADSDAVTIAQQKTKSPQDTSNYLQRIPKSQTFSQISKVALATTIMQKAAKDVRQRKNREAEISCVGDSDERGNPQHVTVNKTTTTPESLV
ncbi:hypothetical protein GWK47_018623 [Chionoecetes opilio]|uniref:Uncharacterized protein n=1 Tax=Chionoecetes opilio TaxID=41210 RepID=A0A8J4XQE8_CHIOP|nr:hypothetical protein GWK47_018623 [Chionoecetes opilio]